MTNEARSCTVRKTLQTSHEILNEVEGIKQLMLCRYTAKESHGREPHHILFSRCNKVGGADLLEYYSQRPSIFQRLEDPEFRAVLITEDS